MFKFLNSTPARVVTILLVLQGALLYSSIRPEAVPPGQPLREFPRALGSWDLPRAWGKSDASTKTPSSQWM